MKTLSLAILAFVLPAAAEAPLLPALPTLEEARALFSDPANAPPVPVSTPVVDLERPPTTAGYEPYACMGLYGAEKEVERRAEWACARGLATCVRSIAPLTADFCRRPAPAKAGKVVFVSGTRADRGPTHFLIFEKGRAEASAVVRFIAGERDEP